MSKETIELAKNYDPKKSIFPALAQRKWDGVPVRFMRASASLVVAVTRQGERVHSVDHLIPLAAKAIRAVGGCVVGECVIPGMDFKTVSGIVRRKVRDNETDQLICKVFDGDPDHIPSKSYHMRLIEIAKALELDPRLTVTPSKYVDSIEGVERYYDALCLAAGEKLEGVMFHDPTKPFQPGKRCWGMGRWKPQPVDTFQVVGFEEAVSKQGKPHGRVGRIMVQVNRKGTGCPREALLDADFAYDPAAQLWRGVSGVGPGKFTHDELRDMWIDPSSYIGHFLDVKHMPDASYAALRQPTAQAWRPEKTEGDILEY